ncbi:uncharacterized protein PV09_09257 [Verruconis gallopava]|uniref:Uncharacterized protein n=1 Tax=Verruconis gallopava TaxID=253628 RepID=A0A0D1YEC1_9PEZI|nr:uncharacterized protein PV09_09257 [Verruconis gallopava]KIV99031.1 hypothetical protein PV09_09257 [Verruconis gallopava]
MKSVVIIGAGPAGLVTAKTLLRWTNTPFKVTVFEAAERIGGMWRGRTGERGAKCSPEMRTNLSRFTVAFSDLPWQSVALESGDGYSSQGSPPLFPKAHQVGAYLEEYAKKYIPKDAIFCNRRVTKAKLNHQPRGWTVTSVDTLSKSEHEDVFDYLIVASGFFDEPNRSVPDVASNPGKMNSVQHSADFRDVASFSEHAGNIVVVGGGISGSEAAATAAFQISNAKHAPSRQKPAWSESKVFHVFDRPFYVLPRFVPQDAFDNAAQKFNTAPNFVPFDIGVYKLDGRGDGQISAALGRVPPERASKSHSFLRSLVGGDNSELGHAQLVYQPDQVQYPGFTGISDTYAEFVRSGLIVPVQGRASIVEKAAEKLAVQVLQDGTWTSRYPTTENQRSIIENVTGVIEATGYQVQLDFLSDEVKKALDYDRGCRRVPVLLSRGSIFAPAIPEIAFVGFYEGPYWGVMEMQARTVAQVWSTGRKEDTLSVGEASTVRNGIRNRDLDIPQFWMADYVGLIEELSRDTGCRRNDSCWEEQTGPVFPARYTGKQSDLNAAERTVREVRDLVDASDSETRFVAAAAFRAMQGSWTMHRKIISRNSTAPGGTLVGQAHFHPREPTDSGFSAEYLYIEEGMFTMDNGYAFPAKRRYIYRCSEAKDAITAWFVREDGESVEKFFNQLVFERPQSEGQGWIAKGKHWCEPDMYVSQCEFKFRGAALERFGITYEVKGPNKDYTHESWYVRPGYDI